MGESAHTDAFGTVGASSPRLLASEGGGGDAPPAVVAELQSQLQDTRMRLQIMQEQQNQMMVRLNSRNSTPLYSYSSVSVRTAGNATKDGY